MVLLVDITGKLHEESAPGVFAQARCLGASTVGFFGPVELSEMESCSLLLRDCSHVTVTQNIMKRTEDI